MRPTLEAVAGRDGDVVVLAAPRIGRFTAVMRAGEVVVPGQVVGTLRVVGHRYDVVAPAGAGGRVASVEARRREHPREYGEPLYRLADIGDAGMPAATGGAGDRVLEAGQRVIHAQMDGQFYLRPSPAEPPFVQVGQRIEPGATLGLVEVMKFFYPVAFESTGPAVIVAVLAPESAPIEAGTPLFVVEAAP